MSGWVGSRGQEPIRAMLVLIPRAITPRWTPPRRLTSSSTAATTSVLPTSRPHRTLRQDPDVILVGELRDLPTIEAAIRAAETGHLVFGTLHTNSASGTINRIIDAFPTQQQEQVRVQLSTSLMAVLCQALLPRVDRKGLVAAYEFMVVTAAVSNMIRENKTYRIDSAIQTGAKFGMRLLDDHLWLLYKKGIIGAEMMIDRSRNPADLAEKVHRDGGQVGRAELDQILGDPSKDGGGG